MSLNKKRTALILSVIAVFLLILDRFLKVLALNSTEEYNLIGEILKFNFAKNYYIAFSLPLGGVFLLAIIVLVIIILLVYTLRLAKNKEWLQVALLINVLFGATSNLFDRFRYSYVIDYIDLKYFTVFNVADMMIVGAVFLLLITSWKNDLYLKKHTANIKIIKK